MRTAVRRVSHSRITDPPDNGCDGCAALARERAFCVPCRTARGLPACWMCGDRRWVVREGRWARCVCAAETKEARNEE